MFLVEMFTIVSVDISSIAYYNLMLKALVENLFHPYI